MLKPKPSEAYVGNDPVINYVALRADEQRTGYINSKSNIRTVYPFQEDGIVRANVIRIFEESGLGLPTYMAWGRTRSGCFFCFYQQKIEWVRLKEVHPELFQEAMRYGASVSPMHNLSAPTASLRSRPIGRPCRSESESYVRTYLS